jgi:hypothetical protein
MKKTDDRQEANQLDMNHLATPSGRRVEVARVTAHHPVAG